MSETHHAKATVGIGKGNVSVNVFDREYNFDLQSASTGRHLFDQIAELLGIKAVWFFGLSYVDSKGVPAWLKLKLRVFSQDVGKKKPVQFKFRAKFFPEDTQKELLDPGALRIFFLQVQNDILNEVVYCPSDTAVLLASYATQAKYGDYTKGVHFPGFLADEKVLPQKVLDQYELTLQEWEDRIVSFYKDHKGQSSTQAMAEYLCVAQDLEMFGIKYFDIRNKKGTELRLGVGALGLYVYEQENSLTPKLGFPWEEIKSIAFNNKKLTIKAMEDTSPNFTMFVPRVRHCRLMLGLAVGNHELYLRRRHATSMIMNTMPGETKGYQKGIVSGRPANASKQTTPGSAKLLEQQVPETRVARPTPTSEEEPSVNVATTPQIHGTDMETHHQVPEIGMASPTPTSEEEPSDNVATAFQIHVTGSETHHSILEAQPTHSGKEPDPPEPTKEAQASDTVKLVNPQDSVQKTVMFAESSETDHLEINPEPGAHQSEYQWQESHEEEQASMVFHDEGMMSGTSSPDEPGSPISPGTDANPTFNVSNCSPNIHEEESATIEGISNIPESPSKLEVEGQTVAEVRESSKDVNYADPPKPGLENITGESIGIQASRSNAHESPSHFEMEDQTGAELTGCTKDEHSADPPNGGLESIEEEDSIGQEAQASTSNEQVTAVEEETQHYQNKSDTISVMRYSQVMPESDIPEKKSFTKDFNWRATVKEDTRTITEPEQDLHVFGPKQYSKLKMLFEELSQQEKSVTKADRQHRQLLKDGLDKYRTLRNIQHGVTKNRIAIFEAM